MSTPLEPATPSREGTSWRTPLASFSRDDRLGLLLSLGGVLACEGLLSFGLLPNPTPPLLALLAFVAFRFTTRAAVLASALVICDLSAFFLSHRGLEPVDPTIRLPVIVISIAALIAMIAMLKRQVLAGAVAKARLAERERANSELAAQAAELERVNRDLEACMHLLSHDLRAPLRTISSYLTLLSRRFPIDAESGEYIRIAVDAASNARAMVTGLLDYAQAADAGDAEETLVSADDALAEARVNLDEAIAESGAEIRSAQLPAVYYHRQHLVQLFQNLIGNAVKYRAELPPEIDIVSHAEGDHWRFDVRDNGRGFDSGSQARLFTMFDRLGVGPSIPGSGMGLALCKRLVERHGGRIWARSHPGMGSTFSFTIPRQPSTRVPLPPQPTEIP